MRSVQVRDPRGGTWTVRVRWEPRWRALSRRIGGWRRGRDGADAPDVGSVAEGASHVGGSGGGGGGGGGWWSNLADEAAILFLLLIGFLLVAAVAWWVLIPLLLLLVDVVVVVVLLLAGIVARVALRRPWTVTARRDVRAGGELTVDVVGWRRAHEVRDLVAALLAEGQPMGFVQECCRAKSAVPRT
ncbi:hypothetical protein NUM3379_17840 [Kineococcus sp. NUM-3379]